ncbi:MAG: acyltransferase family protein [Kiritimatiellia bacterium]
MQRLNQATYATNVIHGDYYPHLDGIRAFAVLPVVLFHIAAALCPGGFAGVDVFFVISGYLIVGGILRDLEQDRFTIRAFYHRRIRRILPAYFVMIALVLAAGCAVYYSRPLVHLSNTVIAATLFAANIYYGHINGDYFAPDIHDYPLLHLWSLSVEEQFYLCIPLLCVLLWRVRRSLVAPVLAALAVGSLAVVILEIQVGNMNSAFYLLHCRAWELLAGALLAWHARATARGDGAGGRCLTSSRSGTLAVCGMALVLLPYAYLSSRSVFPGLATLPSVAGTVLLIRFGDAGWVARVLTWRPFVLTGKISYSLYLWHWPVIVFWKYATFNQTGLGDAAGMFLVSVGLAILSWRFVEIPVRTSPAWTTRRTFRLAACGILLLLGVGAACTCTLGWPRLLHARANRLARNDMPSLAVQQLVVTGVRMGNAAGFHLTNPFRASLSLSGNLDLGAAERPAEVLVTGDSHAWNLQYGLAMVLEEQGRAGYAISRPNTFMYDVDGSGGRAVLEAVAGRPAVRHVVLASRWMDYACSMPDSWSLKLEEFVRCLAATNRTVVIAADIPSFSYSPSDIAARMAIITPRRVEPDWVEHAQSAAAYERAQGRLNRTLQEICARTGAVFAPLQEALRQGDRYPAFDRTSGEWVPLYGDGNHLTHDGSMRAARFLAPYLGL